MVKKIANKIRDKRFLKKVLIAVFVILVVYFSYLQVRKYIVLKYLNQKYGDGDWKIISCEKVNYEIRCGFVEWEENAGVRYKVNSSYIDNKSFYINIDKFKIWKDCFLPTYYSIKYNLKYEMQGDYFGELLDRISFIADYHYPYNDYEFNNRMGPNSDIEPDAFYNAWGSNSERIPLQEIIPDNGHIPDVKEIIEILENYYCAGRKRNKNINDEECYKLAFSDEFSESKCEKFIADSIEPSEKKYTRYE